MIKTTAVSYEGDEYEVNALRQLAKEKGVSVGKLVAEAVHDKHAHELDPLASFFRKRGSQKRQSASNKVTGPEHA